MKTVHAIYENGVFRPTEPVSLPERSEVELAVHETNGGPQECEVVPQLAKEAESVEEMLMALAQQVPEEEWQRLPADLTDHLDHYLYGTPKGP